VNNCPDCSGTWLGRRLIHDGSCPLGKALDLVIADDAEYFESNPEEQVRVRPMSPAERQEQQMSDSGCPECELMIVTELAPGMRRRSPVYAVASNDFN
jgi:hypothetical protein